MKARFKWHARCAVVCFVLSTPARLLASDCRARANCPGSSPDALVLQNGDALCGTIVHREPERFVVLVTSESTQTIAWEDLACLGDEAPAADQTVRSARPAPAAPEVIVDSDEAAPGGFALAWDLRWVGHSLFKRFRAGEAAAWSWGLGSGIEFGAALHYRASGRGWLSRAIGWYELVLGLSGAVTYGTWHQVDGRSAATIEQDVALVAGFIVPLGAAPSARGAARWSGALLGLAWQPSYVDFYGREIDARGAINPAGVRVSLDFGTISGPGRTPLWRLTASYLPYVGRLPSALSVGVGLAYY